MFGGGRTNIKDVMWRKRTDKLLISFNLCQLRIWADRYRKRYAGFNPRKRNRQLWALANFGEPKQLSWLNRISRHSQKPGLRLALIKVSERNMTTMPNEHL
jgi:hypothetical protein